MRTVNIEEMTRNEQRKNLLFKYIAFIVKVLEGNLNVEGGYRYELRRSMERLGLIMGGCGWWKGVRIFEMNE